MDHEVLSQKALMMILGSMMKEEPLCGVTGYFILARRNRFGAAN
jgi:hypothetical protein